MPPWSVSFHYALHEHAPGNTVTPLDERVTQPILIPFGLESIRRQRKIKRRIASLVAISARRSFRDYGGLEGMVVDVEITDWPTPTRSGPRGRVIEVLGREKMTSGSTWRSLSASIICPMFSRPNVLDQRRAPPPIWMRTGSRPPPRFSRAAHRYHRRRNRQGLRRRGPTSATMADTWELQVHIADVAQYVTARLGPRSGSALCAAPRSTFPIAPCPCCRRSFRATSAACGRKRIAWCSPAS